MKNLVSIIVVLFSLVSNAFATTQDKLDRYLNKDTILKQGKEQKKEKKSPKAIIRFTEAILPKEMKSLKKLYPTKRDRRYF